MKTPITRTPSRGSPSRGGGTRPAKPLGSKVAKHTKIPRGSGKTKPDNTSRVLKTPAPKPVKSPNDHTSNQGHAFGRYRLGIEVKGK